MVVKLTPTWESKTKPAKDASGWQRGEKGFARCAADAEYMKTFDPAADKKAYGTVRPNGAQKVMTRSAFPANLRDTFTGSYGVDAGLEGDDS